SGFLLPFVAIYLIFFSPESFSSYSPLEMFLLAISGVVTAVPLLCFSEAVKRAPLNLIGFIQYLNPTIQLLVAILIFGETVSFGELKGFLFIWVAILVFVTGQILNFRKSF
uniref:EamA family transporter n=1 Tax=uncultured Streptococcus sp. TaxID=83427 RepID=UPI0037DCFF70